MDSFVKGLTPFGVYGWTNKGLAWMDLCANP